MFSEMIRAARRNYIDHLNQNTNAAAAVDVGGGGDDHQKSKKICNFM
jgi:hypothetical protein